MAGLSPLTSSQLITLQSTQFAAQSQQSIDDGQGSPLGDIFFAEAQLGAMLDINVQYTNLKVRLATSTGADIDSYVNQFSIFRDTANAASGQISVSPNSASSVDIVIPFGSLCQTTSGLQYQVIADATQASYQADGYHIPAGSTAAITATVSCTTAGVIGNVAANAITQPASGLNVPTFGAVTITNSVAFTNGSDGESDQALIARFVQTISSGRWGTKLAVVAAIESAQTGLTFQIGECLTPSNTSVYGFFTVFVNTIGQSGGASSQTLAAVQAVIAPIKACGIEYQVVTPTIITVPAAATFSIDPNYLLQPGNTYATALTAAQNAYANYVNNIGLSIANASTLLSYAKVSAVLVSVPGVLNVSSFTLNSGTSDITATYGEQIVAGATTFTHS